jgi:hypothetical protein
VSFNGHFVIGHAGVPFKGQVVADWLHSKAMAPRVARTTAEIKIAFFIIALKFKYIPKVIFRRRGPPSLYS